MIYPKLSGLSLEAHQKSLTKLRELAKTELNLKDDGLVSRDIRPEDFGLTGRWAFALTTTSSWITLVNAATVPDNRFISIEGIAYPKNDSQLITQLEVTRAESIVRYWTIQGANLMEDVILYFDRPVTIGQNQPITIKGYNPTTSTNATGSPEEIVFIGSIVEKKGLVIND